MSGERRVSPFEKGKKAALMLSLFQYIQTLIVPLGIVATVEVERTTDMCDGTRLVVTLGIVTAVVGEGTICVRDGVMGAVVAVRVGEVTHS